MSLKDNREGQRFDSRKQKEEWRKAGLPGQDEQPLPPPVEPIHSDKKEIGRNDPCPCGSGKKYKKCCGK